MPAIPPFTLETIAMWEKSFIAALSGSATSGYGVEKAISNATEIANKAVAAWLEMRSNHRTDKK